MKQNVHPLPTGLPELADPLTGWQLGAAWLLVAILTVFLLVGAWTVGKGVVNVFATLVAPTVTMTNTCER